MKYSLITLSLLASISFAEFINPLPSDSRAKDNGGLKNSIDAYNDGIGVAVVDNKYATELNKQHLLKDLVFKYGEKAKISGSSVVDYVSIAPESTTEEKTIAQEIKSLAGTGPIDGTSCDDGNALTYNDVYINGICIGTIKDGYNIVKIQVNGFLPGSNGTTITELTAYNKDDVKITLSRSNVTLLYYGGSLNYFYAADFWSVDNLFDNNINYTSNDYGQYSSLFMNGTGNPDAYTIFQIDAGIEKIKKIVFHVGSPDYRIFKTLNIKDSEDKLVGEIIGDISWTSVRPITVELQ